MTTDLYWIDGPWAGRLAIIPRPRGGDWLEDEVRAWSSAKVDVVVSMLTEEEVVSLDLAWEAQLCAEKGIEYVSFPVVDRGIPSSASATAEVVRTLESKLSQRKNVVIPCRQGIGRSALLAACVLVTAGWEAERAMAHVGAARGCAVPETAEQRDWVVKFGRGLVRLGET